MEYNKDILRIVYLALVYHNDYLVVSDVVLFCSITTMLNIHDFLDRFVNKTKRFLLAIDSLPKKY